MSGLIAMAVLVGAIWAPIFMLRMPLLLGALAAVIVGAGFGYPFLTFSVGGAHWTLDRLLLPLLIGTFVVQRQQGTTTFKPRLASEWIIAAFLVWLGISLFLHDFRMTFGVTATPVWRFSTAYCIPVLIYAITRQSHFDERAMGWMHLILVLFGVYLAITGICEMMHWWAFVFPKHIADPAVGLHFGRARGPMVTAVSFGLYLGASLLCLWTVRDRLGRFVWLVLPPLIALETTALYFSYTRSCWIGAGLGLVLILGLSLRGRIRIAVVAGLLVGASLLMATKMNSILAFQREQSASISRGSAEARWSFAVVSWEMFKDSPIWGVGFGQFPVAKLPYLSERLDVPLEDIRPLVHHNTFLSLLTETGIVGLGLFIALLYAWGRHAWLLYRHPATPRWAWRQATLFLGVLALYACQLTFHELSYSTIDNCLVFFLAAATTDITLGKVALNNQAVFAEHGKDAVACERPPRYRLVPR